MTLFRSDAQYEVFQSGLQAIPHLFLHPQIRVYLVTEHLNNNNIHNHHNTLPYMKRGWTFAEYSWSTLIKRSFLVNIFAGQDNFVSTSTETCPINT